MPRKSQDMFLCEPEVWTKAENNRMETKVNVYETSTRGYANCWIAPGLLLLYRKNVPALVHIEQMRGVS
jgi:hypothetical protein